MYYSVNLHVPEGGNQPGIVWTAKRKVKMEIPYKEIKLIQAIFFICKNQWLITWIIWHTICK